LPMPRPPMSRLPTALTSSMEPGLILIISLPGSTTFSVSTFWGGAASPPTGVVPGAGALVVGGVPLGGVLVGVFPLFEAVPDAGAGWSPPTGAVPGAGWALAGVAADGVDVDGAVVGVDGDWVDGDWLEEAVEFPVDCDHSPVANVRDIAARTAANELVRTALMT